jgi:hypothetical protein
MKALVSPPPREMILAQGCDKASPIAFAALHPRARYVSKAAIWTGRGTTLRLENRSPA